MRNLRRIWLWSSIIYLGGKKQAAYSNIIQRRHSVLSFPWKHYFSMFITFDYQTQSQHVNQTLVFYEGGGTHPTKEPARTTSYLCMCEWGERERFRYSPNKKISWVSIIPRLSSWSSKATILVTRVVVVVVYALIVTFFP